MNNTQLTIEDFISDVITVINDEVYLSLLDLGIDAYKTIYVENSLGFDNPDYILDDDVNDYDDLVFENQ